MPENAFRYVYLPVLSLVVLAHLVSTFWQTPHLWGIHHLYFFPGYLRWILTIAALSLFFTAVGSLVLRALKSLLQVWESSLRKIGKYRLYAAVGLASIPSFWLLRTKLFLLGDGYFILEILPGGQLALTEPLDRMIHYQFYRLLMHISPGMDPSLSYSLLSVVCGGAFVFMSLVIADRLGKNTFQRFLISCLLLTLGSIELFFGYVESYTLVLVGLTLYALFSILYLQGRTNLIPPFLALIFSIGLHILAIVLIPSFAYLVLRNARTGQGRRPGVFGVLSLTVCLGIICLAVWRFFIAKFEGVGFSGLLSLWPSPGNGFTLFSAAHLAEFGNHLLLVSPVGAAMYFFFFYASRSRMLKDPVVNFFLISSTSALILAFAYDGHWGSADWDLMSFPGIFLTLAGILLFIKSGARWSRFGTYGIILMAVSLLHVVPWVLLNANSRRSVDRYTMIATNDSHLLSARGGGMWRIARILEYAGYLPNAEQVLKQGIARDPNELGCYTYLSRLLYFQGRYDEAKSFLERALAVKPNSAWVRFSLGLIYLETEDFRQAVSCMEGITREYQGDPEFTVALSRAYLGAGRPQDARDLLRQFLDKGQDLAIIRGLLGEAFFQLGDLSSAKKEWQTALRIDPDEPVSKAGLEELGKPTRE